MSYYLLKQRTDLPNPLRPVFPHASNIWSEASPVFIPGTVSTSEEPICFLPFYAGTMLTKAFCVSAQLWTIWQEYQTGGRNRPCALGHVHTRTVKPYVLVMPKILDALHPDTVCFRDGNLDTVCLWREKIGSCQVFAVKGRTMPELILSEAVLEEMIRSGITGFTCRQVQIKPG